MPFKDCRPAQVAGFLKAPGDAWGLEKPNS